MTNTGCIMMCVGIVVGIAGNVAVGMPLLIVGFVLAVAGRMTDKS